MSLTKMDHFMSYSPTSLLVYHHFINKYCGPFFNDLSSVRAGGTSDLSWCAIQLSSAKPIDSY